jgi:hypothetical protein
MHPKKIRFPLPAINQGNQKFQLDVNLKNQRMPIGLSQQT